VCREASHQTRLAGVWAITAVLGLALCGHTNAQTEPGKLRIDISPVTGRASFVSAADGGSLDVPVPAGEAQPVDFLSAYGLLFGLTNPQTEVAWRDTDVDQLGYTHTTFTQVHGGIPVFSGLLKVHQAPAGGFVAANGDFYDIPEKLSTVPTITPEAATAIAINALEAGEADLVRWELVIVDPGWYGDPPAGVHLAYYMVIRARGAAVLEAFFIDAHSGKTLDQWSLIHTARNRDIHNGGGTAALPGPPARAEGAPPTGVTDVDRAYDYYGDTYDYYFRAFGRDSIDGAGLTLVATVNSTAPPCPNAFWDSDLLQMVFCSGLVTDDIVGHELTHGVTQFTANLIYQNQPGQLNEAYSDIFGELIDLFNGDAAFAGAPGGPPFWPAHPTGPGGDTPNNLRGTICGDGTRWMVGEDAGGFGGAIRDMWNPPCFNDPDRNFSSFQTCPAGDGGGVHSGSGIANHAFAIMTDGKTFNGYTVSPIGPIKAGAVWYRALTTYLTPASDYREAYSALNLAAADLILTIPNDPRTGLPSASPFTAADAQEVDEALLAVEMNTDGRCGSAIDAFSNVPPIHCPTRTVVYSDNFESGVNGWTVSNSSPPTAYDWIQSSDLPAGRPGTAWFADDPDIGNCTTIDESGTHFLTSPPIALPADLSRPTLAFTHFIGTEYIYDGGNVKISINGGAWQLVPAAASLHNGYNTPLFDSAAPEGNTNPMAGQYAWTGSSSWGSTLLDLYDFVSGGETIRLRFEFGKDGCTGIVGWYVDDVEIYSCPCTADGHCDDGRFCTGTESCAAGVCQRNAGICGDICSEPADTCRVTVFQEDFESGNGQGWNLNGTGSTAASGAWVFGQPNGTLVNYIPAQPGYAIEGAGCAFTGQNSALGTDDVDNGVTYLVSPVINLAGQSTAELTFYRWYYNRDLDEDVNDFYVAQVSENNGSSWVTLENLGTSQTAYSWTLRTFQLEDYIPLTSTVRLRFGASDGPPASLGNIIESAIDSVHVTIPEVCDAPTSSAVGPRHLTVTPAAGPAPVALHVGGAGGDPAVDCVNLYVQADGQLGVSPVFQTPADWGTVYVRGAALVPGSAYEVSTDCGFGSSDIVTAATWTWGNVNNFGGVDLDDILIVLDRFGVPYAPATHSSADLQPCTPDNNIDLEDILAILDAFGGASYYAGCPAPCP